MSFRINASSKYANRHPSPKDLKKSNSLLSEEDYLLFNLEGKSSDSASSGKAVAQKPKSGHCIRDTHAQSDYY